MADANPPLILVVDDDADTRVLLERFLKSAAYRVISVASGAHALALVNQIRPELILVDVMMPEMDGFQVCARLQQQPDTAFIPVVFVTSLGAAQDRARAFAVGAADYLVKPFSREALQEKVKANLETRKRWYQVRVGTELWDEAPLPEKFVQFRRLLIRKQRMPETTEIRLAKISAADIYAFTEPLNLSEEELARQMAEFFGMEYLPEVDPTKIELGALPTSLCRSHHVVAMRDAKGAYLLVISNPFIWGLDELDTLTRAFHGEPYRMVITSRSTISSLFFDQAMGAQAVASGDPDQKAGEDVLLPVEMLPVAGTQLSSIVVVNSLIADAVRNGASDLHIEPERDRTRIRYRIDGHLRTIIPLQAALHPGIVGRLKIIAGMDLTESRKPQDGGCMVRVDNRTIELRASTLPTSNGEGIVLRVLGENVTLQNLEALGMEPDMLRSFRQLLANRQGILLIAGPTGSGKSTTLYAGLNHLNTDAVKIITIEDPVEVDVEGITQVALDERAGRSFANVLRAMLRQDPDILMVGEIRDKETAEVACRAALTGHLVLSTIHTQDALGTLARLYDMGVATYLVSSAMNGVIAQRLVRRVCESCAEAYEPAPQLRGALEAQFGSLEEARFRRGVGCARCHQTGTRGRIGIYELLVVDEDLRRLMIENAAPSVLKAHVASRGLRSMEEDAFRKASRGLIPPESIIDLGFGFGLALDDEEPAPAPAED